MKAYAAPAILDNQCAMDGERWEDGEMGEWAKAIWRMI